MPVVSLLERGHSECNSAGEPCLLGTPTLFIDGIVHRGGYDPPALLAALAP